MCCHAGSYLVMFDTGAKSAMCALANLVLAPPRFATLFLSAVERLLLLLKEGSKAVRHLTLPLRAFWGSTEACACLKRPVMTSIRIHARLHPDMDSLPRRKQETGKLRNVEEVAWP